MRTHCSSNSRRRAISRLDVFAVIVALSVISLGYYALQPRYRCRELSKRLVCGSNVKGIGTSCKIYANENLESWPTPAFDESLVGKIDYRVPVGGGAGNSHFPNRSQPSISGAGGTKALSVSRAYWMLVRSGDITVKQFICPTSGDVVDPTKNLDRHHDFTARNNLSYGFQVPYGPTETKAREGADNKMVFAADKGPYRSAKVVGPAPGLEPILLPAGQYMTHTPQEWEAFNSANHPKEGQNVLYADGHSEFKRMPTAGVDGDNIYTIALDNINEASRTSGESPWLRSLPPFSSTDSVIFP